MQPYLPDFHLYQRTHNPYSPLQDAQPGLLLSPAFARNHPHYSSADLSDVGHRARRITVRRDEPGQDLAVD